jgi:hypothetical protein
VEGVRRRALNAFVYALTSLDAADAGDAQAVEEAVLSLQVCLEWVTPQIWLDLWLEAQIARGDAYAMRRAGDETKNLRTAVTCYRAALRLIQRGLVLPGEGEVALQGRVEER